MNWLKQFLAKLKANAFQSVSMLIVGAIIGTFTMALKIPSEVRQLQRDMKDMREDVNELQKQQLAVNMQIAFNQREIIRLTNENVRDSLNQKYIIITLNDVRDMVKQTGYKLDRLQDGIYHRVPQQ